MKTIADLQTVSFFTLIIFFCQNKLFQRGWWGLCLTLWKFQRGGEGGGHQFLINMENPGRWGVLSEIPSVVGYGYFLEPIA